jgi:predicted ATPase
MKITLLDTYKSLRPFESEELNDFTIITGKNGSGKSQLLEMMIGKLENNAQLNNVRFGLSKPIKRYQWEGVTKTKSSPINVEQWRQIITSRYSAFQNFTADGCKLAEYLHNNNLGQGIHDLNKDTWLTDDLQYKTLVENFYSKVIRGYLPAGSSFPVQYQKLVLDNIFRKDHIFLFKFLQEIKKFTNKSYEEFEMNDFIITPYPEHLVDTNELFLSQVELVYYNYSRRRDKNARSYFEKKEYGGEDESIPDTEFVQLHPEPWKVINEILVSHKIDFRFPEITVRGFSVDINMHLGIEKHSTGEKILFENLSSGEKIIIGLVIKLFTTRYYGDKLEFPDLIILDEPDAYLHPEMSKLLLDVLFETFVKRHRIKVILTTHSPSTIALAPEESIYQLSNGVNTTLRKVSKDEALRILTSFIPTLSIDYRNHRQVFVESPTDAEYFQELFNKHKSFTFLGRNLYFISNSMGNGNCDLVYSIVKKIRVSGNNTVFGIVDWDTKNLPEDRVHVHGVAERYSIENFLLDPIYIVLLLIKMKAHDMHDKLGISEYEDEYSIRDWSVEKLQLAVDIVFLEIADRFQVFKHSTQSIHIEYLNGVRLQWPTWYAHMQGHELEDKLEIVYPALAGKYRNEGEMKKELTKLMIKLYPLVPQSSINVIEKIANE